MIITTKYSTKEISERIPTHTYFAGSYLIVFCMAKNTLAKAAGEFLFAGTSHQHNTRNNPTPLVDQDNTVFQDSHQTQPPTGTSRITATHTTPNEPTPSLLTNESTSTQTHTSQQTTSTSPTSTMVNGNGNGTGSNLGVLELQNAIKFTGDGELSVEDFLRTTVWTLYISLYTHIL